MPPALEHLERTAENDALVTDLAVDSVRYEICGQITAIQHCLETAKRALGGSMAWPQPSYAEAASTIASELIKQLAVDADYTRRIRGLAPEYLRDEQIVDQVKANVSQVIAEATAKL